MKFSGHRPPGSSLRAVSGTDTGRIFSFLISPLWDHHMLSSVSFPVKGVWGQISLPKQLPNVDLVVSLAFVCYFLSPLWFGGVIEGFTALLQIIHMKTLALCIDATIACSPYLLLN